MNEKDFQTKLSNDSTFEQHLEDKIQHNSNYYLYKWKNATEPFKFAGWNWSAFFLTPFWLSYRQMYRNLITYTVFLFIIISITLSIPVLLYYSSIQGFNPMGWTITTVILLHLYYGFKGNAVYAKYIASLFQWDPSEGKTNVPLFNRTGRSWVGAFIAPVFILVFIAFPTMWLSTYINTSTLPYGTYVFLEDQGAPQSVVDLPTSENPVFRKYSSTVHLLYYSKEPVNNQPFQIVIHHRDDENEEWVLLRDRTITFFTSNIIELDILDAEDPLTNTGEYQVEVFINGEQKGSTLFEIQL